MAHDALARLQSETLRPLVQAIEAATGYRPHLSTAIRWVTVGVRGVRLESVCVGRKRLTSVEAIHRFNRAATEQSVSGIVAPPESPQELSERARAAADELAKRLGGK